MEPRQSFRRQPERALRQEGNYETDTEKGWPALYCNSAGRSLFVFLTHEIP